MDGDIRIFKDIVHGSMDVDEPVIKELAESKPMQRVKAICNHGVPKKYIADFEIDYSRFDNSVGVMLASRRVGTSQYKESSSKSFYNAWRIIFTGSLS